MPGSRAFLAAALLLTPWPPCARAGDACGPVAKIFARAAERRGLDKIAVLPFVPIDGSDPMEGLGISERVTTRLAIRGAVAVVERSLLAGLMEEHRLGATGALDPEGLARLGRLAQAKAVVLGTFAALGNTVEADARLIELETGLVIEARTFQMRRTHYAGAARLFAEPAAMTAEEAVSDVLAFQRGLPLPAPAAPAGEARGGAAGLRDAPAQEADCRGAARRIDRLEEGILDLKARYWARQVQAPGFSAARLRTRPGQVLSDPALRARFNELLRSAVVLGAPPLTLGEVRRFIDADRRAFELYDRCLSRPGAGS